MHAAICMWLECISTQLMPQERYAKRVHTYERDSKNYCKPSLYCCFFWMNFRGVREPPIAQGTSLDRRRALEKSFPMCRRSMQYVQRARCHLASITPHGKSGPLEDSNRPSCGFEPLTAVL